MGILESASNYVLREPGSSPLAFIVVLLLLACLIFILFKIPVDLYIKNKWYLVLSLIPAVIAFLMSLYMASYGRDAIQILHPGVYLISLVVFSGFFGAAVLFNYLVETIISR